VIYDVGEVGRVHSVMDGNIFIVAVVVQENYHQNAVKCICKFHTRGRTRKRSTVTSGYRCSDVCGLALYKENRQENEKEYTKERDEKHEALNIRFQDLLFNVLGRHCHWERSIRNLATKDEDSEYSVGVEKFFLEEFRHSFVNLNLTSVRKSDDLFWLPSYFW
jgi:hypothetical protein